MIGKDLITKPYFGGLFLATGMLLYFAICYICRAIFGIFDVEEVGATETLTSMVLELELFLAVLKIF